MSVFEETYLKALIDNRKSTSHWTKCKEENETLKTTLQFYSTEYKPSVMIPIGKKALMKGHLVHTNEILVALGDGYFVKSNTKKALEICDRRIKHADEFLEKFQKESNMIESRINIARDMFGNSECKDIVEPFNEEEDKNWRIEHRQKERVYKNRLRELKETNENKSVESEKDLWERLDALELQEELADELHRLGLSEGDESDEKLSTDEKDSDDLTTSEEEEDAVSPPSDVSKRKKSVRYEDETNHIKMGENGDLPIFKSKGIKNLDSQNDAISDNVVERQPEIPSSIQSSATRPMSRFKSSKK